MLLSPTLLVLLAASPVSLAQPEFNLVNVDKNVARFCGEHLATEMAARGIHVVTAREIESMIGLDRQRQLMGCNEVATSCMAELANALGTDGIVLGDLAKLGSVYQLNLRVISSQNNALLAVYRASIDSEGELVPELTKAAQALVPEILKKLGRAPTDTTVVTTTTTTLEPARAHHWPLLPTVAAGAFAVAGAALHGFAYDAQDRLVNPVRGPISEADAEGLRSRGNVLQTAAYVGYGAAAASLGYATFLYLRGEPKLAPSAMVTPAGATIGVAGVFP